MDGMGRVGGVDEVLRYLGVTRADLTRAKKIALVCSIAASFILSHMVSCVSEGDYPPGNGSGADLTANLIVLTGGMLGIVIGTKYLINTPVPKQVYTAIFRELKWYTMGGAITGTFILPQLFSVANLTVMSGNPIESM